MIKVLGLNLAVIFIFTFLYFGLAKTGDHFNGLASDASLMDAIYFAFTVQSTVGFGDIYPKSKPAKMLVMMQQTLLILGVIDLLSSSKPKNALATAPYNALKKPTVY